MSVVDSLRESTVHSRSEWTTMGESAMSASDAHLPFQLFDPEGECVVTTRHLPHWAQSGALCFITWRTWDSMPRHVLDAWLAERNAWLVRQGIDPRVSDWKEQLLGLLPSARREYQRIFSARWEASLDECRGSCVLRRPEAAVIVADSLKHFDGDRYVLSDFIVMPNHVHLLAAFHNAEQMLKQCGSWKHYTATQLNRLLGRRGRFWEVDGFDHLVRTPEQYEYLRRYIAENPRHAGLGPGESLHYSRDLSSE